ncbi:uncharacterized protein P884DRAFT_257205 [Thermothelomyces heterothallicus CBS 202.75]|uniref:uncharacterized protein n=1 Tax=Thermothelomyces heterothallicus CBS 202.75 TaxID=1149848 RepID=UPI00374226CA
MRLIQPSNLISQSLSRLLFRPPPARRAPRAPRAQPLTTLSPKQRPYSTASQKPNSGAPLTSSPTSTATTITTTKTTTTATTNATASSAATAGADSTRAAAAAAATTRLTRLLSRLPRPLQRYASRLRGAPLTHVAAFLVLHEITAVVPLLALFGLFHYTDRAPVSSAWVVEHCGAHVREGVGRFERWFAKKGWFGFGEEEEEEASSPSYSPSSGEKGKQGGASRELEGLGTAETEAALERWEADPKYRILVEIGLAYALTKVLLPVRIAASVWATPWFAGVLGRLGRLARRRG